MFVFRKKQKTLFFIKLANAQPPLNNSSATRAAADEVLHADACLALANAGSEVKFFVIISGSLINMCLTILVVEIIE